MHKNVALLSIGAALLSSLFMFGVAHAVQIDKRQAVRNLVTAELNGTANASTTQVSSTSPPCTENGMRRTGAPCQKHNLAGSGEKAREETHYTSTGITATLIVPLIVPLIALIFLAVVIRLTPQPPSVKNTH